MSSGKVQTTTAKVNLWQATEVRTHRRAWKRCNEQENEKAAAKQQVAVRATK